MAISLKEAIERWLNGEWTQSQFFHYLSNIVPDTASKLGGPRNAHIDTVVKFSLLPAEICELDIPLHRRVSLLAACIEKRDSKRVALGVVEHACDVALPTNSFFAELKRTLDLDDPVLQNTLKDNPYIVKAGMDECAETESQSYSKSLLFEAFRFAASEPRIKVIASKCRSAVAWSDQSRQQELMEGEAHWQLEFLSGFLSKNKLEAT